VPDLISFPQVISSLGKITLQAFLHGISSFSMISYLQQGLLEPPVLSVDREMVFFHAFILGKALMKVNSLTFGGLYLALFCR